MSSLCAVLKLYYGRAVSSRVNNKVEPQAATTGSLGDLSNPFRHRVVNLPTRFVVINVHEDVYFGHGTPRHSLPTGLTTRPDGTGRDGKKNLIPTNPPFQTTLRNLEIMYFSGETCLADATPRVSFHLPASRTENSSLFCSYRLFHLRLDTTTMRNISPASSQV